MKLIVEVDYTHYTRSVLDLPIQSWENIKWYISNHKFNYSTDNGDTWQSEDLSSDDVWVPVNVAIRDGDSNQFLFID